MGRGRLVGGPSISYRAGAAAIPPVVPEVALVPPIVPPVVPQLVPVAPTPIPPHLLAVSTQFTAVPPDFAPLMPALVYLLPLPEPMVVARARRLCRERGADQHQPGE
jgi:hypothetical protein